MSNAEMAKLSCFFNIFTMYSYIYILTSKEQPAKVNILSIIRVRKQCQFMYKFKCNCNAVLFFRHDKLMHTAVFWCVLQP